MKARPQLTSVMTPFPYSVDLDTPLEEAMALMEEHDVRHLPVTEAHELVGVITERDMHLLQVSSSHGGKAGDLKVKDVYITDAYVVDLAEPLDNVLMTMAAKHIGSAIITRKGKLAGVFTSTDACRCFSEYIRERFPPDDGNDVA